MVPVAKHPLQWYVDKIERGEPFSSLLYGDGEFYVAMGSRLGARMQYGEIITKRLMQEMLASFEDRSEDIIRGTDENLINYREYKGRDYQSIQSIGKQVAVLIDKFPHLKWVDGVVWEDAVRAGALGPLLRALQNRDCVLVANTILIEGMRDIFNPESVAIPGSNAFSEIDDIERHLLLTCGSRVYILCMGLSAIPLIMRLRSRPEFVEATFLDLGSVLDVFVRGSEGRGWRNELYTGPASAYEDLIKANLKELEC